MRSWILACGLSVLAACGASGPGQPDDGDAGEGGADAGGGAEDHDGGSGVMPKPPGDIIDLSCSGDEEQLRIAVSREFQEDSACYPEPGVEAVILTLERGEASPGETVTFTAAGGGHAYVCPADEAQPCVLVEEGEVAFETFGEAGASGTFSLDGGARKGLFDALWCADAAGC